MLTIEKKADKYKKELRIRATLSEKHIRKHLINIKRKYSVKGFFKFKYQFQKSYYDYKGNLFIVDFYFPTTKTSLEIDGGYHDTRKQKWRDYYKEKFIKGKRNGRMLRLTNEQALNMNENEFLNYLIDNHVFTKCNYEFIRGEWRLKERAKPICTNFANPLF